LKIVLDSTYHQLLVIELQLGEVAKQQDQQGPTTVGRISDEEIKILAGEDTESLQDCLDDEDITQVIVSVMTPNKSFAQDIIHISFSMRPISRRHGQQQRCTILIHMLFLC
jgi:hypothetical protein